MSYRMMKKPASMRVKEEKKVETFRYCRECSLATWNEEYRNYKGEIFFGYCPFGKFGYNKKRGQNVTYTDELACSNFEEGGSV